MNSRRAGLFLGSLWRVLAKGVNGENGQVWLRLPAFRNGHVPVCYCRQHRDPGTLDPCKDGFLLLMFWCVASNEAPGVVQPSIRVPSKKQRAIVGYHWFYLRSAPCSAPWRNWWHKGTPASWAGSSGHSHGRSVDSRSHPQKMMETMVVSKIGGFGRSQSHHRFQY